ncbi:MAG: hypothetical protein KDC24_09430, partial [Saprospiraceae bacterium]|nr:hypothetical protein [Saprospiraceae bacterium]
HPDHHAFWIHPNNPNFLIDGNDGGLNFSYDRGKTWRFVENLPVGQFYHVNIDNSIPYQVGGGMQDNGSWVGPSDVWQSGGIRNHHFKEVAFGDGFDVVFRPDNPRYVYAMSQGGNVSYIDSETGKSNFIKPYHPDGEPLRFNWNAAIAQNPFYNKGVYFGSQYLHKSDDCGQTWKIISPDLTTNDSTKQAESKKSGGLTPDVTDAENYTTITAIAPSPLDSNLIWVGSDDGYLHVTKDGGKNWMEISSKLPNYPQGAWIPQIEVSKHNKDEVFVVVNDYRRNDFSPYLYHSKDAGKTWSRIANEKNADGYVRSVVQDPVVPNLLFMGTDHGLFFSFDYGKQWQKWDKHFPSVPVADLKIQERENDLVIGTFGRSLWIMDDISPLRALAQEAQDVTYRLFPASNGYLTTNRSVDGLRFSADAFYTASNGSSRVEIPIFKKVEKEGTKEEEKETEKEGDAKEEDKGKEKKKDDKFSIVVFDMAGDTVRNFTSKPDTGLQYLTWRMETNGVAFPSRRERKKDADPPSGPSVFPGKYKIMVSIDDWKDSTMTEVFADPRLPFDLTAMEAEKSARDKVYNMAAVANGLLDKIKGAKKSLEIVNANMKVAKDTLAKDVLKASKEMGQKLDSLELLYFQPQEQKGIPYEEQTLMSRLWTAINYINNSDGPPTASAEAAYSTAERELEKVTKAVDAFFEKEWTTFQEKANAVKVDWFDLKEE